MIWLVAMVDEFAGADGFEDVEIDQIVERLAWTPRERLDYLLDMLAFEERAHRARRIPAGLGEMCCVQTSTIIRAAARARAGR